MGIPEDNAGPGQKAYRRWIRRYIVGQDHRWAVIVPPELAGLCLREMKALGMEEIVVTEAGLEFVAGLNACYRCNLWLRTASRVLCRFPEFRAGAVEELFRRVSGIRWELWLSPGLEVHVEAFVRRSRIEDAVLVEKAVHSGIGKRLELIAPQMPIPRGPETERLGEKRSEVAHQQKILVHLRENRCEISLDSTGPHLHRRGYRLQHAGAPLRETLASAVLLKAEWTGSRPLVDGMCGAGTLAAEAVLLSRRLAPGLRRSFLFELWPSLQEKQWGHMRRKAEEGALPMNPSRVVALDICAEAVQMARENACRAGIENDIEWLCMDFFAFRPARFGLDPGLVVLNPPYGKRLNGGGRGLYERLGGHLRSEFKGWQAAVLAADRASVAAMGLKTIRSWNVTHGGIPLVVAFARL